MPFRALAVAALVASLPLVASAEHAGATDDDCGSGGDVPYDDPWPLAGACSGYVHEDDADAYVVTASAGDLVEFRLDAPREFLACIDLPGDGASPCYVGPSTIARFVADRDGDFVLTVGILERAGETATSAYDVAGRVKTPEVVDHESRATLGHRGPPLAAASRDADGVDGAWIHLDRPTGDLDHLELRVEGVVPGDLEIRLAPEGGGADVLCARGSPGGAACFPPAGFERVFVKADRGLDLRFVLRHRA